MVYSGRASHEGSQPLTLVIGERPVLALKQEGPEVDVGDVDRWIIGGDRHIAGNSQVPIREKVRSEMNRQAVCQMQNHEQQR